MNAPHRLAARLVAVCLGAVAVAWSTLAVAAPAATPAAPAPRVALVIGNAAYKDASLTNPVNDAVAMAAALREAGFQVQLHTDVDQRALAGAVRDFGDRLRKAQIGVFYFAGHGMQIKGRNYLVPVGAEIQREDEVAYATLDAQAVLDKMETAGNGTNVMILDACRNNPFARSFRSSLQGLAQMEAPVGTLVAFATAPGSVASDGAGKHGLYTGHLLREIRAPGAKVEEVFKRVRAAVRRDSAGKQVPWESTSLEGDLTFFAPPAVQVAATAAVQAVAPAPVAAAAPGGRPEGPLRVEHDRRTAELLAELSGRTAARPATAPPAAAPAPSKVAPPARSEAGYTVGDRWNYQVIDRQRGEVVRNYTLRVARLLPGGGWATAGNTVFDAHGRLVEAPLPNGGTHRFSPHALRWWPDLKAGDRRSFELETARTRDDGTVQHQRVSADAQVVGLETVRVPAGEFRAWRIEFRGSTRNVDGPGYGTFRQTVWYSTELRNHVALDNESRWDGQLSGLSREELTSLTISQPGH
jgi:hypothetical protein